MPERAILYRSMEVMGAASLLACSAMVPWAHAAKCAPNHEERVYELIEIRAVDGGSVPEAVRVQWAEGASVSADDSGFDLLIPTVMTLDMVRDP